MKYKFALFLFFLFSACVDGVNKRIGRAVDFADQSGFKRVNVKTGSLFDLAAFVPKNKSKSKLLTIFIEGDGFAWRSRYQASSNPTPKELTMLKMVLKYGAKNDEAVLYLARPCQYVDFTVKTNCQSEYWTSHRFAPEVVDSTERAIDILKKNYQASQIKLIGYSGGGAVAALVAARRSDVQELITIAGNLDIDEWVKYHHISKLSGSLNPANYASVLYKIKQRHFVGVDDKIIPLKIAQSYAEKFGDKSRVKILPIDKFNHKCCWDDNLIVNQL